MNKKVVPRGKIRQIMIKEKAKSAGIIILL